MDNDQSNLSNVVIASAFATVGLAAALSYTIFSSSGKDDLPGGAAVSCDNSLDESVLNKEIYPGGHVTIFYGSQTGTAETFALDMQREGENNGFKIRVVDLEDVGEESEILEEVLGEQYKDEKGRSRAIFLMATYGEGEPTDNAQNFVNVIQQKSGVKGATSFLDITEEKRDPEFLSGLDYAVFGLGNTQYEHYNSMGKLVDEALINLGAVRIATLSLGDDDKDLEGDFENWRENIIWSRLAEKYVVSDVPVKAVETKTKLPKCPYVVEYVPNNVHLTPTTISEADMHKSTQYYFTAVDCPVTTIRELRSPDDPGSTVHVEINISQSSLDYQTADNLAVLPVNDSTLVASLAEALSYDLDAVFNLNPTSNERFLHFFPTPCTVKECLSRYVDITSAPRRSELKRLAIFASDPLDREAMLRMASKEGKAEYREKIVDANIGIVDIITRLCKSMKNIPLEYLIQICPHLQPRYYTIASSSSVHPDSVHMTVSVINEKRSDESFFKGVCSNYLAREIGAVRVFCRDSTFRLPKDPSKPIIMVGPGTGVAPMRALLQERSHMKHNLKLPVGPNILYFGCKKRKLDFIYEDELLAYKKAGDIDMLRLAFSREQEKKVYVQHLVEEDGVKVWDLLEKEGAYVYICGGIKMGNDVCSTLKKIVMKVGKVSCEDGAKKYLDDMNEEGRLVQELWA